MKRAALFFLLIAFQTAGLAQTTAPQDSLKAAFIFHFIGFTEWNDRGPDYYVCIPEDGALREAVRDALRDKIVNGRHVQVVDRYDSCHVLVSDYYMPDDTDTLTIGTLNKGALMEFRTVEHKLKFAVNPAKLKTSNLKISSQLLKLAIMDGPP